MLICSEAISVTDELDVYQSACDSLQRVDSDGFDMASVGARNRTAAATRIALDLLSDGSADPRAEEN